MGNSYPLQKYETKPQLGDAMTIAAPSKSATIIEEPTESSEKPSAIDLWEEEVQALKLANSGVQEESDFKKIPATDPATDPRRSECWIQRIKDELDDSSPLMKKLWPIDRQEIVKRVRVIREVTKLNLKESKLVFDAVNEMIPTTSNDAMETARQLASKEGILGGISSGAALWAAIQVSLRPECEGKKIVVIIPDTGERYISTEMYE